MSMHLAVGLTTTSTKKRKKKLTKSQQEELERNWRDRNQWLKKQSLPTQAYEQFLEWVYGKGKKEKSIHQKNRMSGSTIQPQTSGNKIQANNETDERSWKNIKSHVDRPSSEACTKKPQVAYTGKEMVGIAQMSKSNAVPVFSQQEILDIARMRR